MINGTELMKLEVLVEKAKLGDMQAKEKLYLELVNKVYYFALKTVKSTDDAMDIVQDSFIMAFDKLYTLKEANAFQTWLFRIVGNNCRALFNKQSKNILLDEEELEDLGNIEDEKENIPCEIIDQKETSHLVMEIIEKLPEAQRSCILLYYYNEFSVGEIAEILVCSAGTVKSRLNYARKQIKEAENMSEGQEKDNKIKGAQFLERVLESNSLRTMSMAGGKAFPYNFACGFRDFANGHLLQGIKNFMRPVKVPKLPKEEHINE